MPCIWKKYLTLFKLNEHALKHSEGRLTCAWCNKSFSEKEGLQDHQKRCKKGQVMKSSHGSAGIVTGSSPGIMTETITLKRVIPMPNNLQSDGPFANQTVSCDNRMVKLTIRWIFTAFMCSP